MWRWCGGSGGGKQLKCGGGLVMVVEENNGNVVVVVVEENYRILRPSTYINEQHSTFFSVYILLLRS